MKPILLIASAAISFGGYICWALSASKPIPGPSVEYSATLAQLDKIRSDKSAAAALRENYEFFKKGELRDIDRLQSTVRNTSNAGERLLAVEEIRKIEARLAEKEARIDRIESGKE